MWPWGHAAVGYLLLSGWCRARGGGPPAERAAVLVGLGAVFPDLVDKPLAWTFGLLPTGRSLGHSWLVAAVVLAAVCWLVAPERRAALHSFGVGWFSHGLADGIYSLLVWEPAYLGFLLWPLASTPPYDTEQSFLAHFLGVELTPFFLSQFVLVGLALLAWDRDGRPGGRLPALGWSWLRDRVPGG